MNRFKYFDTINDCSFDNWICLNLLQYPTELMWKLEYVLLVAQRVRFWRWRRYRRPSREHLGSGDVIENWNIPSANARYIQPDHCGGTSPRVVVSVMIVVISGEVAARAVTRALHSSIAKSSMLAPCPSDTAPRHAAQRAQQLDSQTLKAEAPRHAGDPVFR